MSNVEARGYFGAGGGRGVCAQLLVLKLFSPVFECLCWVTAQSFFGKRMQVLVCRKGSKLTCFIINTLKSENLCDFTGLLPGRFVEIFPLCGKYHFIIEILKSQLGYYVFLTYQVKKALALPI